MNCPDCGAELTLYDITDINWDTETIHIREVWGADGCVICQDGITVIRHGNIDWDSEIEWN